MNTKTNKKNKKKIIKIISLIFGILILIVALLYGYFKLFMDPYRGTIESYENSLPLTNVLPNDEACEDLDYLFEHLKTRHPAWLDGSDERVKAINEQYNIERKTFGDTVTVLELNQAASRICAILHDGHTNVWCSSDKYLCIDDFTQIIEYGNPVTINEIPTEDILSTYKKQSSYELDFYIENKFYNSVITTKENLAFCGLDVSDGVTMTFDNNGEELNYKYSFVPIEEVKGHNEKVNDNNWVDYKIDKKIILAFFIYQSVL